MKNKVLFLAIACALLLFVTLHGKGMSQSPPRRIEVVAKRFAFEPAELTLKKGEPVVLVVTGEDFGHGLRIHELNVDLKTPGNGGKSEVELTPDTLGDFIGQCSVFCGAGHGSMTLTVHVVP